MSEEKGHGLSALIGGLGDEELDLLREAIEKGYVERNFCIDIDEVELEFEGQTPRLTGRIEINLEVAASSENPSASLDY